MKRSTILSDLKRLLPEASNSAARKSLRTVEQAITDCKNNTIKYYDSRIHVMRTICIEVGQMEEVEVEKVTLQPVNSVGDCKIVLSLKFLVEDPDRSEIREDIKDMCNTRFTKAKYNYQSDSIEIYVTEVPFLESYS